MTVNHLSSNLEMAHSQGVAHAQKQKLTTGNHKDIDEVKKLSEQFESIFLGIVLKSMRKSVPESGLIKKGNGEEIFRSMLDTEYAKSLAAQRTTGLAESIEKHLTGLMQQTMKAEDITGKIKGLEKYQVKAK